MLFDVHSTQPAWLEFDPQPDVVAHLREVTRSRKHDPGTILAEGGSGEVASSHSPLAVIVAALFRWLHTMHAIFAVDVLLGPLKRKITRSRETTMAQLSRLAEEEKELARLRTVADTYAGEYRALAEELDDTRYRREDAIVRLEEGRASAVRRIHPFHPPPPPCDLIGFVFLGQAEEQIREEGISAFQVRRRLANVSFVL